LLESLTEIDFTIIFVTAYSDFALRAFDFFTFAYLVKPFKRNELIRVVSQFLATRNPSSSSTVKVLSESMASRSIRKVVISEMDGFHIIPTEEIIYLKSDGNYTEFVLADQEKRVGSKTLKEYDQVLQTEGFFRTHRSYLVNLSHVKSYTNQDGGTVIVSNGDHVPIGRRRMSAFRDYFLG
ncbi:MAG: LytTR family DNA-binding domain-containing protein, partial [Bacteroidota bacterium]